MTSPHDLVSIVIPVFNGARYVGEAIGARSPRPGRTPRSSSSTTDPMMAARRSGQLSAMPAQYQSS